MHSLPIATTLELVREQLARGCPLVLAAEGHSMWPLIQHGDLVAVAPLDGPPRIGDIVLFALGTRLVLHRVVSITPTHVVTKGDATPQRDPPLSPEAILGRLPSRYAVLHRALAALSRRGGGPLASLLQRVRLALQRLPL